MPLVDKKVYKLIFAGGLRIAAAMLHGAGHAAPLALAPPPADRPPSTPEDVGYIHSMFRDGGL